jgi:hypothetical protein
VALARQRGEHELDLAALAVDDRLDVVRDPARDVDGMRQALVDAVGSLGAVHTAPQSRRHPLGVGGLTVHPLLRR